MIVFSRAFANFNRRHTAGNEATIGQGYSIPYRASGTNRSNPAAKPPVKSTPNRDNKSRSTTKHIVKKEASMVQYNFNLNANAEACFRTRLAAVTLAGCVAVAAAVRGPTWAQPYAP
ncbi:hypothetical protein [Variovorax guangxiensis]|uniref:hypothetical protein n=1 Tax=Variovorax guangxiensis TaxID=1775474 RepID=UPI00285ABB12|nr:hypothetical protein [Variovorax guangxiensis]MDR6860527.1 hypothetical protein [Variovorax guangxiensis]